MRVPTTVSLARVAARRGVADVDVLDQRGARGGAVRAPQLVAVTPSLAAKYTKPANATASFPVEAKVGPSGITSRSAEAAVGATTTTAKARASIRAIASIRARIAGDPTSRSTKSYFGCAESGVIPELERVGFGRVDGAGHRTPARRRAARHGAARLGARRPRLLAGPPARRSGDRAGARGRREHLDAGHVRRLRGAPSRRARATDRARRRPRALRVARRRQPPPPRLPLVRRGGRRRLRGRRGRLPRAVGSPAASRSTRPR